MLPFEKYPHGGNQLLKTPKGDSARRGYGVPTFNIDCGYVCVYCGFEMSYDYSTWLSISVDHVIPAGNKMTPWASDRKSWIENRINLVTCCRACNEFLNQYPCNDPMPNALDEFVKIRDKVFREKKKKALGRHRKEREWYEEYVHSHGVAR
jgi:5-methylcytosine-specific restriction endonuclease McrA